MDQKVQFSLENADVHVVCGSDRPCGFRVNDEYFEQKTQYTPGICPRCNAGLILVKPYTNEVDTRFELDLRTGKVRQKKAK